jgi:hypothetical protein
MHEEARNTGFDNPFPAYGVPGFLMKTGFKNLL